MVSTHRRKRGISTPFGYNNLWRRVSGGSEFIMLDGSPHDDMGHMEGAKEG